MNKIVTLGEFMNMNVKRKVEYYYAFFFENFALSSEESNLYKPRIINILKDKLDSYYFDSVYWYVKKDKTSKSISQLQSELGHLTKRWGTDWAWIIHHIILDFLNISIADYLIKKYGSNVIVYKWLPDKYFKLADEVYLKDTTTREPLLFRLDKLIKAGTTLNLSASNTRPNIGVTLWNGIDNETYNEIWDVTELRKYEKYRKWDKNEKKFVFDDDALEREEKRLGITGKEGKIKIRITDSEKITEIEA